MPAYNAESFVEEAIQSVLKQTYPNLELLIVNDGSSDATGKKILQFTDGRIKYFSQQNKGVSAARNVGLEKMSGDFFCFLDADDTLPINSLFVRVNIMLAHENIDFADGIVMKMNDAMSEVKQEWKPRFTGNPLFDLIQLNGNSFFGPTWMIRKKKNIIYKLLEGLTHGEDLLFYMDLARKGGDYAFVEEPVLHYRNTKGSAMKNLYALEKGYREIESEISKWPELSKELLTTYHFRWRKFMALDYLKRLEIGRIFGLIN